MKHSMERDVQSKVIGIAFLSILIFDIMSQVTGAPGHDIICQRHLGKWSVKCTVFVYFMLIAICGVYLI